MLWVKIVELDRFFVLITMVFPRSSYFLGCSLLSAVKRKHGGGGAYSHIPRRATIEL